MDELISVVVSTYNWPEALNLALKSLSLQTDSNFEIVVADDGSGPETARVVDEWRRKSSVRIIHSWQEDKGFRLARSRNAAVTRCSGGYLVFMDGDCIVRRDFVASHRRLAERRSVLAGQRILVAKHFFSGLSELGRPDMVRVSIETERSGQNSCRQSMATCRISPVGFFENDPPEPLAIAEGLQLVSLSGGFFGRRRARRGV